MHHGLSRLPDSLFGQSGSLCMSGLASSYQLNNRGTVRGSEEAYSSRQPCSLDTISKASYSRAVTFSSAKAASASILVVQRFSLCVSDIHAQQGVMVFQQDNAAPATGPLMYTPGQHAGRREALSSVHLYMRVTCGHACRSCGGTRCCTSQSAATRAVAACGTRSSTMSAGASSSASSSQVHLHDILIGPEQLR